MLTEDVVRVALMILEIVKTQVNHSFTVKDLKEKVKNNSEYRENDESLVLEAATFLKGQDLIHQTDRNQFQYKHKTIEEIRFLAEFYSDLLENYEEYFGNGEDDGNGEEDDANLRLE